MFAYYVIPFCIGVIALLIICSIKFVKWIHLLDKQQKHTLKKNIISNKFLLAIWEIIREGLLHIRISKHHPLLGYMHRSLAFGWFLLIVMGFFQAMFALPQGHLLHEAIFFNYFEPRTDHLHHHEYEMFFANLMDILLIYILSGLLLAMLKSVWSKPLGMKRTTRLNLTDRIAKFALWAIFPLRLVAESCTSAIYHNGGFMIKAIGNLFAQMSLNSPILEYNCWMLYSLALGTFFCLMPFTRYMHIFTEILLIILRKWGVNETDKKTGYTFVELSACSRCGICIDRCPINKYLDNSTIQGVYMLQTIRNKDLWNKAESIAKNCMMCDQCVVECPVGIDLSAIRTHVRSASNHKIDNGDSFQYLKKVHPFNAIGRIAYFGGCMSHLTPAITNAMESIFNAAGQKYWYMDKERSVCCGRPLRQQGLTKQADELKRKNSELIEQSGATMLVTSCPICYKSFKKEYDLKIPVLHHSEYIDILIKNNKLSLNRSDLQITYHDPCELGRGCGIYNEPRNVIDTAATLVKTNNERDKSICCGFNLGNISITNKQQEAIRDAALENLTAPNPDIIATACPMCKKALSRSSDKPVKDIAEIVVEQLKP